MSILVDPALFLEWIHWTKPSLTDGELRTVRRLRSGQIRRVSLDFVDTVMTRAGAVDQMNTFYPIDVLTCLHGHSVQRYRSIDSQGRHVCMACRRLKEHRRHLSGRMFVWVESLDEYVYV